jgi:hypothetical protein
VRAWLAIGRLRHFAVIPQSFRSLRAFSAPCAGPLTPLHSPINAGQAGHLPDLIVMSYWWSQGGSKPDEGMSAGAREARTVPNRRRSDGLFVLIVFQPVLSRFWAFHRVSLTQGTRMARAGTADHLRSSTSAASCLRLSRLPSGSASGSKRERKRNQRCSSNLNTRAEGPPTSRRAFAHSCHSDATSLRKSPLA